MSGETTTRVRTLPRSRQRRHAACRGETGCRTTRRDTTDGTRIRPDAQTRELPVLPSGTVTFLFTDIEGSTTRWEQSRAAMATAVNRHIDVLRTVVAGNDGVVFKIVGDAVQAAFSTASNAVAAAVETQRTLSHERWPEGIGPVRVRMALHTTAVTPHDGDYLAPGLNRLARLLAAAHGGQVLLSLASQELARDALPPGTSLRDLGEHPLRDLYRPERVFQLLHPDWSPSADWDPVMSATTRDRPTPGPTAPALLR